MDQHERQSLSPKSIEIDRTTPSDPGDTEEQGTDTDLDNALNCQADNIRSSPQPMVPNMFSNGLPVDGETEKVDRQDRLARNRQKARIRRERKRSSTETMIRNISALHSRNDDLRAKNQTLIQELAKYGVIYSGEPICTANQGTSTLDTTSLRTLQQLMQQQPTTMQGHTITMNGNGSNGLHSQPLRNEASNTSAPLIWPNSIQNALLSCAGPLQQTLGDNQRQHQQRLRQEAAAVSMLLEMTQHPSTHMMQNSNQHAPHIPGIGGMFLEGSNQSFLSNNMIAGMGNQSQQLLANLQQIIGSHQMGQSPPPVLDHLPSNGQSQIFQTNTSALTTVVSNSTQNHPHPAPK